MRHVTEFYLDQSKLENEQRVALLRYFFYSFCCINFLTGTIVLFHKDRIFLSLICYFLGSIIWDYFERMRPTDYGWWSLKKKHLLIYLAWPFYLVYFYFDFKKKLNSPERFWVFYGVNFSEIGLNKSKIKKFRNFEEATVFARNMAKEYQSIASIQDQSLFKWRQRQPWEGNGGEWDILRFIVEPSGEIKKSY